MGQSFYLDWEWGQIYPRFEAQYTIDYAIALPSPQDI